MTGGWSESPRGVQASTELLVGAARNWVETSPLPSAGMMMASVSSDNDILIAGVTRSQLINISDRMMKIFLKVD